MGKIPHEDKSLSLPFTDDFTSNFPEKFSTASLSCPLDCDVITPDAAPIKNTLSYDLISNYSFKLCCCMKKGNIYTEICEIKYIAFLSTQKVMGSVLRECMN